MVPALAKRRSTRQMAGRKRSQYYEPDSEDDLYDMSDDYEEAAVPRELDDSPRPRKRPRNVRHNPGTRSKSNTKSKASPSKRQKSKTRVLVIGKKRMARENTEPDTFKGPSDGVIPPWSTLPYHILRDIFIFGAQVAGKSDAKWLLGVARLNRALTKPALDALYHSTPISSPADLHGLLATLRNPEGVATQYNAMVKRLVVDVQDLLYTAPGKSVFRLEELALVTPLLRDLDIRHPTDKPPYRVVKLPHWHYPRALFDNLNAKDIRLTAWRWSHEMLKDGSIDVPALCRIHEQAAFQNLSQLELCQFSTESSRGSQDDGLWTAINKLDHIKDITFINCKIVEKENLRHLPKTLERLALCGCLEANSDVLAHYLNLGALHLKELILNHNPAIDLAFLPELKTNCPKLQVLRMEMIFYSEYDNIDDGMPLYDDLIRADEIPTWPSTMRVIDIQHMQKCDSDGAVNLFQSLVDSAHELPDLRRLVLQAHLSIPWRDRIGFRDRWVDTLQRVFKRNAVPPNPYHGSKRQYRLWQEKLRQHENVAKAPARSITEAEQQTNHDGDSSAPRRSRRVETHRRLLAEASDTSLIESDMSAAEVPDDSQLFVQGLCDVVDVQIDNQRPREIQVTEQDFLDREVSGDEDWNENADDVVEEYAW